MTPNQETAVQMLRGVCNSDRPDSDGVRVGLGDLRRVLAVIEGRIDIKDPVAELVEIEEEIRTLNNLHRASSRSGAASELIRKEIENRQKRSAYIRTAQTNGK